ncbi:hypothetical protein HF632_11835, partial [Weissella cibaria]|nr:hypothetical protein [Weissella cibaria]
MLGLGIIDVMLTPFGIVAIFFKCYSIKVCEFLYMLKGVWEMIRKGMLTLMLASAMLTSLSPISAVILADSSVADAYKTGSDSGVNKLPAVVSRLDTIKDNTIKGVDLTSYQAELSAGVKFYDFNHTKL